MWAAASAGVFPEASVATTEAEMEPYRGPGGKPTTLVDSIYSTIPGSPVFAAKADHFERDGDPYGLPNVKVTGHNALQGHFHFAA